MHASVRPHAPRAIALAVTLAALTACAPRDVGDAGDSAAPSAVSASTDTGATAGGAPARVASIEGFKTPESALHDAAANVWFVSNINGNPSAKDGNGFISRLRDDGTVDSLMFIAGGRGGVTLNAPKGMALLGDTLVVADIDAVRMFDKRTGAPVATVSFAPMRANFLNDVTVGGDGALYITDTGVRYGPGGKTSHPGPDRVFKIAGRTPSEAIADSALAGPNGITWDAANRRFVVVSFAGTRIMTWTPGGRPTPLADGPGQFDGVAVLGDGRVLVSSWADSSLYVAQGGRLTRFITGVPSPADIGVDTARGVVAVPLFTSDRVEFWRVR